LYTTARYLGLRQLQQRLEQLMAKNRHRRVSAREVAFMITATAGGTGVVLNNCDLSSELLAGFSLHSARLRNAILEDANFACARLQNADLSHAHASDIHLEEADLSKANVSSACLKGALISGASFPEANLSGADLSNSTARNVNFMRANATKLNLVRGDDDVRWMRCDTHMRYRCACSLNRTLTARGSLRRA